jgi:hypothetical protein
MIKPWCSLWIEHELDLCRVTCLRLTSTTSAVLGYQTMGASVPFAGAEA